MAKFLPEDLKFEILLWLPVKSLLRFQCVSKAWPDLIDSRYFAKLHVNYASTRPLSLLITVLHTHYDNAYDVVNPSWFRNGGSPLAYEELPYPWDISSAYCVGQCHGLVCIEDSCGALLWNLATRKKHVFDLPPQGLHFNDWGFGYDEDSDDYKVVAIEWGAMTEQEECRYMVWIYSLRSRSWKHIDDFPYFLVGGQSGAFVNGVLHWKVCQQEDNLICALHLGKLEYYVVPKPNYSSKNTAKQFECLGVLDGRLYAVCYSSNYGDFDLWIMNEYGVKESWTMLFRRANYMKARFDSISVAYLENDKALLFNPYFDYTDDFESDEALYDFYNGSENVEKRYGCESQIISFKRGHKSTLRSYGSSLVQIIVHVFMFLVLLAGNWEVISNS